MLSRDSQSQPEALLRVTTQRAPSTSYSESGEEAFWDTLEDPLF